jgi:hypothetical protein
MHTEMPDVRFRRLYVGVSLGAFAVLLAGLIALRVHPIVGILLAIAGMAMLLYAAAGLFRAIGIEE